MDIGYRCILLRYAHKSTKLYLITTGLFWCSLVSWAVLMVNHIMSEGNYTVFVIVAALYQVSVSGFFLPSVWKLLQACC